MLSYFSLSPDSGHGPILFYDRDHPYYDFTNFAEYEIVIDSIYYRTLYFQSQKLIGMPFLRKLWITLSLTTIWVPTPTTHICLSETRLAHGQGWHNVSSTYSQIHTARTTQVMSAVYCWWQEVWWSILHFNGNSIEIQWQHYPLQCTDIVIYNNNFMIKSVKDIL